MTIAHSFELILFAFAIADLAFGLSVVVRGGIQNSDNKWYGLFCIGGAVWAFAFAELIASESVEYAYICRSIGMLGMFIYMISVVSLFTEWCGLPKKATHSIRLVCSLGLIIYPFNIQRDAIEFYMTPYGMSYNYAGGVWAAIFTIYTVYLFVAFLAVVLYMMRKKNKKRTRKLAVLSLIALVLFGLGNILDTVMPVLGFAAFPGTTFMSFFGIAIVYFAMLYVNNNRITLSSTAYHLYKNVKLPILAYDENRTLMIASEEADRILGVGKYIGKKVPIEDILKSGHVVMAPGQDQMIFDTTTLDEKFTFQVELNRLRDEYGDTIGFIAMLTDTTERTRFIKQLNEARIAADEANRAKSSFLANMSHEIRTPINTVLGMNEMIRRETDIPEVLRYSENIHDSGEALLSIINDILDFSKVEAGMMEIVESEYDTKSMLTGLINMFKLRTDEKGLDFVTDIDPHLPCKLYGDEIRVRQILINLLSNAVKYTARGTVTLRISREHIGNNVIRIKAAVEDTGIGIRQEDIATLFDSFTRVEDRKVHHIEGTGLGLNIVKELTRLMKGDIQVKSEYGKGSVFTFSVDQRIIDASPVGEVTGLDGAILRRSRYRVSFVAPKARILVVDDNRMNLEVVRGLLKKTKIQVDICESGMECLDMVRENAYHVILLDHMMPVMDGMETLRKLKDMPPEVNLSKSAIIIALTANAIRGAKEQYLEAGFDGYIAKPIEADKLEKIIKRQLPTELIEAPGAADMEEQVLSDPMGEAGDAGQSDGSEGLSSGLSEEGIDLKTGLSYCGTIEIYRDTAQAYCDTLDEMCTKLAEYRENRNVGDYRILIHGIKSNARTLGCDSLYRFALRQEDNCKAGDFEAIIKDGGIPENMARKMRDSLVKALKLTVKTAENTPKTFSIIDKEAFNYICSHVTELLDDFEATESLSEFSTLLNYDLGEEKNSIVKETVAKIKTFDYDGAVELIKKLQE